MLLIVPQQVICGFKIFFFSFKQCPSQFLLACSQTPLVVTVPILLRALMLGFVKPLALVVPSLKCSSEQMASGILKGEQKC